MTKKATKDALWWMQCMIAAVCRADKKHATLIYKLAKKAAAQEARDE
jgi:hypothetical protein